MTGWEWGYVCGWYGVRVWVLLECEVTEFRGRLSRNVSVNFCCNRKCKKKGDKYSVVISLIFKWIKEDPPSDRLKSNLRWFCASLRMKSDKWEQLKKLCEEVAEDEILEGEAIE